MTADSAPRRVLVTGSRDWTDYGVIEGALLRYASPWDTVVHGGAPGADAIAVQAWQAHGGDVECHPYPSGSGKRGGYLRNKEMVDAGADLCLAFIKDNSRGATMCAGLAEAAGIPVKIYREGAGQ